jgi:hypothetical protein
MTAFSELFRSVCDCLTIIQEDTVKRLIERHKVRTDILAENNQYSHGKDSFENNLTKGVFEDGVPAFLSDHIAYYF